MSASNTNSAIFMTDNEKTIAKKIKSHAFSGGGASREEHEQNGGNPDVDVAYQYLSFFEDDDEKMESLAKGYRAGTLSTSQMKEACIVKLQQIVGDFQAVSGSLFRWSCKRNTDWVATCSGHG
jgi:tryptophanyl-tRNA synthetase